MCIVGYRAMQKRGRTFVLTPFCSYDEEQANFDYDQSACTHLINLCSREKYSCNVSSQTSER